MKNKIISLVILCILLLAPLHTVYSYDIPTERDVIVLFDASGSMDDTTSTGERKIDVAKDAVNKFLHELTADDRVALIVFHGCSGIDVEAEFTYDHDSISESIVDIESEGKTPIEGTLLYAWEYLKNYGDRSHLWYIVIFTDGEETCGGDPCSAVDVIVSESHTYVNTPVFTVGFLIDPDSQAEKDLKCIAQKSGGEYFPAPDPEELEEALKKVVEEIKDSDGDGVPDNLDECPNTGKGIPKMFIEDNGCIECYDEYINCASSLVFLCLPPVASLPVNIFSNLCAMAHASEVNNQAGMIAHLIVFAVDLVTFGKAGDIKTVAVKCIKDTVLAWLDEHCKNMDAGSCAHKIFNEVIDVITDTGRSVFAVLVHSPVDVYVYDENGNELSLTSDEIDTGVFIQFKDVKLILIGDASGKYRIETRGQGEGTYDMDIKIVYNGELIGSREYTSIETHSGKVDTYTVDIQGNIVTIEKEDSDSNIFFFFILVIVIIIVLVVLVFSREYFQRPPRKPAVRKRLRREPGRREIPLLEVHKAKREDAGKNIVRIDKKTRERLGIKKGNYVYIVGESKAKAKVASAHKEDTGKNIIRMNKKLREKAGVNFKDKVKIEKAEEDDA